jgi:hypothetical protein
MSFLEHLPTSSNQEPPMSITVLSGRYTYQSFRNDSFEVIEGQPVPFPSLAQPWTPPGVLDVETDKATSEVTGTLDFGKGAILKVSGKVVPPGHRLPAGFELMGTFGEAVYQIRGWFVPEADRLVGTVLALANDLAKAPDGTAGYFVAGPA